MDPDRREILMWVGGALLVVALVVGWLILSAPETNLLPEQYQFGVL